MKSNPITRIAGTNYGSAPANQEVTVDPQGKTPAKFERMSPVKQVTDPIEEDVQNEGGGLERGNVTFDFSPGSTKIIRQPSSYTWSGPLDTSGDYYKKLAQEEGFKKFDGTIKEYEQFKLKKMKEEGDPNVGEQQGKEVKVDVPGSKLAKFAYTPQTREADTFTIRQSRKQDRDVRATKRRLDRAIKQGKDQGAIDALQAKYDRKLREQSQGVNPYLTKRSKEDVKAPKGTQTKSQFESKYGVPGFTGIQDTTSDEIKFYNGSETTTNIGNRSNNGILNNNNIIANFNQRLNDMHNSVVSGNQGDLYRSSNKKVGSPAFKMKGYGSNYNK